MYGNREVSWFTSWSHCSCVHLLPPNAHLLSRHLPSTQRTIYYMYKIGMCTGSQQIQMTSVWRIFKVLMIVLRMRTMTLYGRTLVSNCRGRSFGVFMVTCWTVTMMTMVKRIDRSQLLKWPLPSQEGGVWQGRRVWIQHHTMKTSPMSVKKIMLGNLGFLFVLLSYHRATL